MTASLAMLAMLANGYFWLHDPTPKLASLAARAQKRRYDLYESQDPSPYWMTTSDSYQLKMRLPDLEPHTVSAELSSDGTKIQVVGEPKIEGCSCKSRTVKAISLPYRPRPEDVDVTLDDDILLLKLARHAKADAPVPLKVSVLEAAKPETPVESNVRPLRFIPHESAAVEAKETTTSTTLEEKEKSLTDKFRSAALASLATTHAPKAEAAAIAEAAHAPGDVANSSGAESEAA